MNRKALPLASASLLFFLLGCASTPTPEKDWALGEWRFRQTFSTPAQDNVLTGKLRIERGEGQYQGSLYLDVLKEWEVLDEVQVSKGSIHFYRPGYPESFDGTPGDQGMKGKWNTRGGTYMDGHWEATRN